MPKGAPFPSRSGGRPFVVYGILSEPVAQFVRFLSDGKTHIYDKYKPGVLLVDGCVVSLMTTLEEWAPYWIYGSAGQADQRSPEQRMEDDQQANRLDRIFPELCYFLNIWASEEKQQLQDLLEKAIREGHTLTQTFLEREQDYTIRRFYPEDFSE